MFDEFSIESSSNSYNGSKWSKLSSLSPSEPSYAKVAKRFYKGWKHSKKARPQIHAMFKILSPSSHLEPYLAYRAQVENSGIVKPSKAHGNEKLLFHGTDRYCQLGEDDVSARLCGLSKCSLCFVIRGSFDIAKCGQKNSYRRFGTGIYTSACSSKADDYSHNGSGKARLRVMLVNRVVVGKAWKTRESEPGLTEPPPGYHSVVGKPGVDLNYPETVVYRNDAIRPAYLIVYGPATETQSRRDNFITTLFRTPLAA